MNRRPGILADRKVACWALFALCTGIMCGAVTASEQVQSVNAAAAVAALERASSLAGAGEWEQASFEAQLGASYDPTLADFPYIEALTSAASGKPRAETIARLEQALSRGLKWRVYERTEAVLLCARMYAETLRYADSLALLASLGKYPSADADFIRAWCLYGQKKNGEAREIIASALDRWPFDSRFPRLFLERSASAAADERGVSIAHTILSRLYVWENEDRSLLLLAVPFESDPSVRDRNIRTWRSMGSSDSVHSKDSDLAPKAAALALEYGIIGELDAVTEVFGSADSILDLDAVGTLFSLVATDEARILLFSRLGDFSGAVFSDRNNDGISDSLLQYAHGRPELAVFDTNQDGVEDYRVECDLGAPRTVFMHSGTTEVRYSVYPSVRSVRSGSREYTLKPESLYWAPVEWVPLYTGPDSQPFFEVVLTETEPVLSERLLIQNASFYTEPDPDNSAGIVRFVLDSGIPVSAEAREQGAVYRHTTYLDGYPSVSKLDRDGDGRFETVVYYSRNSSARTVLVDANGNRTAEYRETIAVDGSLLVEWDSDEDGRAEVSWKEGPGTAGVLSWVHPVSGQIVSVDTDNGFPRSVRYSGKKTDVLKDPFTDIWWVGKIPSAVRSLSAEIEAFFNRSGSSVVSGIIASSSGRVFAVRSGGLIYAELLDE